MANEKVAEERAVHTRNFDSFQGSQKARGSGKSTFK